MNLRYEDAQAEIERLESERKQHQKIMAGYEACAEAKDAEIARLTAELAQLRAAVRDLSITKAGEKGKDMNIKDIKAALVPFAMTPAMLMNNGENWLRYLIGEVKRRDGLLGRYVADHDKDRVNLIPDADCQCDLCAEARKVMEGER